MADSFKRKTRLKKYLSHNGKWQFSLVVTANGRPKLALVIIDAIPSGEQTIESLAL